MKFKGNFWLLLIFYLFFIILTNSNPTITFFIIFFYQLIYSKMLFKSFNVTKKILFFYIGFLFLSIIFKENYLSTIKLLFKLQILVMLSAGFITSQNLNSFLYDTKFLQKIKLGYNLQLFIILLATLLNRFFYKFSNLKFDKNLLDNTIEVIKKEEKSLDNLYIKIKRELNSTSYKREKQLRDNIIMTIIIIIVSILMIKINI